MLNKKDKYMLRAKGNSLKSIVIIGKDGLDTNLFKSINDAIKTHELIKISILKSYTEHTLKEVSDYICKACNAEFIYSVGRTILIYKKNEDINQYGIK